MKVLNDDSAWIEHVKWTMRNPCECLLMMEDEGPFRTASGAMIMYNQMGIYNRLLSVPQSIPIELKGIAV